MRPLLVLASLLVPLLTAAAGPRPRPRPWTDGRVRLLSRGVLEPGAAPLQRLLVVHPGGAAALSALGFSARQLSATVAEVAMPAGRLPLLLAAPGVLSVEAGRRLLPLLDQSVKLTGAPAARAGFGLSGKGVLIAIVDTGLDLRHADFRRADGTTRVRWLLDAAQRRAGEHPGLPDYGGMAVYAAAEIDALLRAEAMGQAPPRQIPESDTSGHGTHVAGIAAASGRATARGLPASRYVGMAPEAELCIVQGSRAAGDFADADVVTGVRFCLDRARQDGMPVVVNLSLGGLGGPHDGSSALERALDELFPQGAQAALICAAGNAGGRDRHASGRLTGDRRAIGLALDEGGGDAGGGSQVQIEIYYDGPGPVSVQLVSPTGQTVGPAAAGASERGELQGEGRAAIDNEAPASGQRGVATVVLSGAPGQRPALGEWRLVLTGQSGRMDAWVGDLSGDLQARFRDLIDVDTEVELPASARSAISVGSFTSRVDWPRLDGATAHRAREELYAASLFTAAGPTQDGRFAPDLSAPGEFIVSALSIGASPLKPGSSFFYASDPGYLWADDGLHAVLRGTSQAAPHVAGAAALLLQQEPGLSAGRLRELLRTTARGDGYSVRLGFGRVDVLLAARVLRGERAGPLDPAASAVGVSRDLIAPGTGQTTVTVTPRDAGGLPLPAGLQVEIESTAGTFAGPVRDTGLLRYERVLVAGAEPGVMATITARVAGVELYRHPGVRFAYERGDLAPARGGGCSAAPGRERLPAPALVLLIFLAQILRRRPVVKLPPPGDPAIVRPI